MQTYPSLGVVKSSGADTGDFWPLGKVPCTVTEYCVPGVKPRK